MSRNTRYIRWRHSPNRGILGCNERCFPLSWLSLKIGISIPCPYQYWDTKRARLSRSIGCWNNGRLLFVLMGALHGHTIMFDPEQRHEYLPDCTQVSWNSGWTLLNGCANGLKIRWQKKITTGELTHDDRVELFWLLEAPQRPISQNDHHCSQSSSSWAIFRCYV